MTRFPSLGRACATAAAAALALALPAAASAAPDWTPSSALAKFGETTVEYDDKGQETAAHQEFTSFNPLRTRVVVTTRSPGADFADQLVTASTSEVFPLEPDLAVAPSGAAVLGWTESVANTPGVAARYRAAYRSPSGDWEPAVTIATDAGGTLDLPNEVTVAIGPNDTAVAIANHIEPNSPGETKTDSRADAIVHPPSGRWESSASRLSAPDRASTGIQAGVDADGNVTATYGERYAEASFDRFTVMMRRRSASNGVWTSPEDLTNASPGQSANAGALDVAPDGRAIVGVQWNKNGKFQAYAARRESAAGNFGAPQVVSEPANFSGINAVGIAPNGTAYAVYNDQFNSVEGEHVGLVRAAPGGAFTKPLRVSSRGITLPSAAIDFSGDDAVVAWTGREPGGGRNFVQGTRWGASAPAPDAFDELEPPTTDNLQLQDVSADPEGGVIALWSAGALDSRAAAFDGGAPVDRDSNVPSDAAQGQSVTLRASFADRWSSLAGAPSWDFGDGATATGNEVTHAFATAGDHTVTARQPDALGNTRTRTFTVHVTAPATADAPPPAAPAAPPAQDAPAQPAAPTVTLTAPKCSAKLSKAGCKLFLVKRSTWTALRGRQTAAARVEVAVKRRGAKAKVVKATVRDGRWTARLKGLKPGATTFTVRGFAADGTASPKVAKKVRLR